MTTSKQATFDLPRARDYAAKLSHSSAQGDNPMLARLRRELPEAIAAAEAACQLGAPFEACLEKQSHVLWLCNQCDYYTTVLTMAPLPVAASKLSAFTASDPTAQSRQQIKSVFAILVLLKLLNHIQRVLPGPTPPAPAWRDILPSIRLWQMGPGRHE